MAAPRVLEAASGGGERREDEGEVPVDACSQPPPPVLASDTAASVLVGSAHRGRQAAMPSRAHGARGDGDTVEGRSRRLERRTTAARRSAARA